MGLPSRLPASPSSLACEEIGSPKMGSISRTLDLAPGNEAEVVRRNLSRLAASKQPNFVGVHPRDVVQEDVLKLSNGFVDFVWSYKADGIRGLISISY
ncbi:uncharacterized protein PSANT_07002 [Moesziomyces antarcticus]|uniref:Uncharacterized protein n=2 Tax=Pseudozyma antarctica TaxID=84753 RepID=A0A5C3FYJ6_PSEA2|nr:uncharacterized protein PSANT_07002 [Moesziomyces antarcticus]